MSEHYLRKINLFFPKLILEILKILTFTNELNNKALGITDKVMSLNGKSSRIIYLCCASLTI